MFILFIISSFTKARHRRVFDNYPIISIGLINNEQLEIVEAHPQQVWEVSLTQMKSD